MIKKTFFCFIALLTIYSLLWQFGKDSMAPVAHEFWQENSIKAQNYIYAEEDFENVIVGSSIAAKLVADSIPGSYNLAMVGQSAHDGLAILVKKGKYPKRVFIETNTFNHNPDNRLINSIHNPLLYNIQKLLISARDGHGPIDILIHELNKKIIGENVSDIVLYDKGMYRYSIKQLDFPADSVSFVENNAWRNVPYSGALITELSQKAREYIDILRSHNTEVIFFEMPYNEYICDNVILHNLRQAITEAAPAEDYIFLPNVLCGDQYSTFDGIHLDRKGGENYTRYLKHQIDSLKNIGK